MLEHLSQIEVRYSETDMMGIVYHGSYLPWLEVGRTGLLAAYGLPYRELEAAGFYLPVTEIQLRYLRPARYGDTLTIRAAVREKPAVRLRVDYLVCRASEVLAEGHTRHVFVDKPGRPRRPPPAFLELAEARFPGG